MQINYWQTLYEEGFYHIYNRSNGKAPIFAKAEDAAEFLKRFKVLVAPYCDVLAYCLMRNHFHFVLYCKPITEELKTQIAKENTVIATNFVENRTDYNDFMVAQFARLFLGFSKYYNNKYNRDGNLFQKKFKRIQQETIEKVVSRVCYVHHNPIHHDAASFYDAYRFSSFNAYLSDEETAIAKTTTFSLSNQIRFLPTLNLNVPFETGIYEPPTFADETLTHFLHLHALFHQEWLEKKTWEDFDEMED